MKFPPECAFFLDHEEEIDEILMSDNTYLDIISMLLTRKHITNCEATLILLPYPDDIFKTLTMEESMSQQILMLKEYLYERFRISDTKFRRELLVYIAHQGIMTCAPKCKAFIDSLRSW